MKERLGSDEGAEQTSRAIEAARGRVFFRALDLGDMEEARSFKLDAIDFLGGLDSLLNNAGTNSWFSVAGSTYNGIQKCLDVNFFSAWVVSKEAYPAMKAAGGGMVLNIASIHAERTLPEVFPYNVSKAALEWGKDNIQAATIAPALIQTPLAQKYLDQSDDPDEELTRLESHYPLTRSGKPEEIASLVVYLFSKVNRFISGQTILVDGGISALIESPDS